MGRTLKWMRMLVDMVWPRVCEVCRCSLVEGEDVLCLGCDIKLPRTMIHRNSFNSIHQRIAGKAPIEHAGGYFYYYRESEYAELIHVAKYGGRPRVARVLAAQYARELIADSDFFSGIDIVLPVPLHKFKLWKRGYNQSDYIADGVADVTGIPVGHNLVAKRHGTQTRRNAYMRWLNTRNTYDVVKPEDLEHKHVLVVDDVVTTGATLLSCCEAIHRVAPTAKISVLVLAVAQLR